MQQRINESTEEKIDLSTTILHVAEQDGKVIGMLPVRLIWQAEPLWIFPEVKHANSRRRAALLLARAMEHFVADRVRNKTGIHSYFFVTRNKYWQKLAEKFGAFRIYRSCKILARDL